MNPIRISLKSIPRSPIDIGSGNGLAPKKQQAITWNSVGLVHWRMYAALGGHELREIAAFGCVHNYAGNRSSQLIQQEVCIDNESLENCLYHKKCHQHFDLFVIGSPVPIYLE